jgi:hypothetical protein
MFAAWSMWMFFAVFGLPVLLCTLCCVVAIVTGGINSVIHPSPTPVIDPIYTP